MRDALRGVPSPADAKGFSAWLIEAAAADVALLAPALRHSVQINNTTLMRLNPDAFDDLVILCRYSTSA